MKVVQRLFAILITSSALAQEPPKKPSFPTGDEIELVVSQAERAFDQYNQAVTLESGIPSMQEDKTGIERDRQVVTSAKTLVAGLKRKPQAFHGVGGLLLLGILDDASRNAALCSASTFAAITSELMSEKGLDRGKAYEFMHIGQACQDASVQLYTVSENVHALMLRELESQQVLNQEATEMLTNCTSVLKNSKRTPGSKQ
jgi:hypothetical protein